jgi:hypothetical protein
MGASANKGTNKIPLNIRDELRISFPSERARTRKSARFQYWQHIHASKTASFD